MRRIVFYLLLFFGFVNIQAADKKAEQAACKAYENREYAEACKLFHEIEKELIKAGDTTATAYARNCYNLGNCHYRLRDYPLAVLYYRRSLKVNPANEDARFNLSLTESKLKDRFVPPSEMFFISWVKDFILSRSSRSWGLFGLSALFLTLLCFGGYRMTKRPSLQKVGFGLFLLFLLVTLWCEIAAGIQYRHVSNEQAAVLTDEVQTFDAPTPTAKKVRLLHEGTTVNVTDRKGGEKGEWVKLMLPDETEVWAFRPSMEKV